MSLLMFRNGQVICLRLILLHEWPCNKLDGLDLSDVCFLNTFKVILMFGIPFEIGYGVSLLESRNIDIHEDP